jgi:hypothetical protein
VESVEILRSFHLEAACIIRDILGFPGSLQNDGLVVFAYLEFYIQFSIQSTHTIVQLVEARSCHLEDRGFVPYERFEVFTAVTLNNAVLWDITSYGSRYEACVGC